MRTFMIWVAVCAAGLSAGEIDDLVSFLIRVGGPAKRKPKEEEFEE